MSAPIGSIGDGSGERGGNHATTHNHTKIQWSRQNAILQRYRKSSGDRAAARPRMLHAGKRPLHPGHPLLSATLNVDDPCVADELSMPTIAGFKNGDDPSA